MSGKDYAALAREHGKEMALRAVREAPGNKVNWLKMVNEIELPRKRAELIADGATEDQATEFLDISGAMFQSLLTATAGLLEVDAYGGKRPNRKARRAAKKRPNNHP